VHVLSDSLLSDERGEFAIPSYMQPAPAVGGAKSSRDLWRKGGGLATGGFASSSRPCPSGSGPTPT